MTCFIQTSASISIQGNAFEIAQVDFPATLAQPDYKELIPAAKLRRMSLSIKMGSWCAQKCELDAVSPIIVGTGLGCLADSEKFLSSLEHDVPGGPADVVSPTPFIQSTHNTIAGQLALLNDNRAYNSTHVQEGHSFEVALMDAMLMLAEGEENILVGGVDERIDLLNSIAEGLDIPHEMSNRISEGAAFFKLSTKSGDVKVVDCNIHYQQDLPELLKAAKTNGIDLVLFGQSGASISNIPSTDDLPVFSYSDHFGLFMTNPALGMDLGARILQGATDLPNMNTIGIKKLAVINSYCDRSFGMITLECA